MRKSLLFSLLLVSFSFLSYAQSDKFWSSHAGTGMELSKDKAISRLSFPKEYKLFDINYQVLSSTLYSAAGRNGSTIITLPNAEGSLEQFQMFEASNFEPALQARFPQIRAFSGKGITDPSATIKLSLAPSGIQSMVFRAEKETEFMEPFSSDHKTYSVYHSSRNKGSLPWTCTTEDHEMFKSTSTEISRTEFTNSSTGELKTMRLAQSCNGEYANFFGASTAGTTADTAIVLAAYNGTLTRCNGVYEKDLAVHLNLIPTTGNVIYFNPATDPYTNLNSWNGQLQAALTANVGEANYDIGHMFGASGGGGNAGCIGCVCVDGIKGSGITSPADNIPMGDNFDIDYVAHEVGHQMGGNHTFSFSNEGTAVQKEVGSGVTIMGYAGITSYDVSPHSIDIFHETSIAQIQANLAGKTCPITTNITANNATPVVAPVLPRTIPISTPFTLTGSATDANPGDVLTYCWEQNDNGNGQTAASSNATPPKLTGPNWISFLPTVNPVRTFPILATILAGNFTTPQQGGDAGMNKEALSSVSRTLNFRLTVRDNVPYSSVTPIKVGQTAFTDVAVTVTNTSGPFAVTAPNTNVSWNAGSTQTITWSVNNTTAPPVSCANVKISLSTDGGQTFPTVLAASTPNDGTEDLVIPGPVSTTARIKVEAVGNIFFDISNSNFIIALPANGFTFGTPAPITVACASVTPATTSLTTAVVGTFVTPIALTYSSAPAGPVVVFATNPVVPGSSTIATVTNAAALPFGNYVITVTGTAGAVVQTATINLTISAGTGPVFTLQPANQATCVGTPVTFSSLATGALSYQWQVSTVTVPAFTNIAGATNPTFTIANPTIAMNGNQYRVVATGQCNTTNSSSATLTVNTPPAITTQPVSQTVCAGTNATFSVIATGSAPTYQWQVSTTAIPAFTDIPGATASTYTVIAVTLAQNGNQYRVVVSGACPPPVTSAAATLTVGDAATITAQPQPQTVCSPANATFSVTATGSSLTYQWQVSTDAGANFTDVPGATASTYTFATTPALNGNLYRVRVFSCTPTGITSNNALLTVNTPITVSAQPTDKTVCQGTSTTFSVTAAGTGATYQWQKSATGCGGTFTNITGATSSTYTIANPTPGDNGGYRVIVTGTCGAVNSTCATLLVNTPVVITTQPQNQAVCIPNVNSATFNVTVTGTAPTYQWQISTNGGTSFTNITGATASSYTVTPLAASQNNNQYRVVVSGTCSTGGVTSTAATLTVNTQVAIVAQPQPVSTCTDQTATFTVGATGSTITYQWQVSVNGGPFVNLVNDNNYSGVNTATLTVSNLSTSLSVNQYRVIVSGVPCGSVTSAAAALTVNIKPTVILTAASYTSITPYIRTGLFTTISPVAPYLFKWYKNGVLLPTVTSSNLPITVDDFGEYYVTVTNELTGCSATSNKVSIKDSASNTLFVYPNPSKGNFHVRFYNATGSSIDRTVRVYDSKGAVVFSQKFTVGGSYGDMNVSLDKITGSGTYFIDVRDNGGKRVAESKIVIQQ